MIIAIFNTIHSAIYDLVAFKKRHGSMPERSLIFPDVPTGPYGPYCLRDLWCPKEFKYVRKCKNGKKCSKGFLEFPKGIGHLFFEVAVLFLDALPVYHVLPKVSLGDELVVR